MFKSIYREGEVNKYFASSIKGLLLPASSSTTLYSVLLSIHDGTFFASWWVFVNDFVSVLLLVLLYTGMRLWYRRVKRKFTLRS